MKNRYNKANWDVTNFYALPCAVTDEILKLTIAHKKLNDALDIYKQKYINWDISITELMDYQGMIETSKRNAVDRAAEVINSIFNSPMYRN